MVIRADAREETNLCHFAKLKRRTIFAAYARYWRPGERFVVRTDEKLSAGCELEAAIRISRVLTSNSLIAYSP